MCISEIQNGWCENEYLISNSRNQMMVVTTKELIELFELVLAQRITKDED